MKKIKIVIIFIVCGLLTGCPPIYKINIRNEAPRAIVVFYPQGETELLRIDGNGGEGDEYWNHYCFAINDNGNKLYFDGTSLPDSVYQIHAFSTSLKAIYSNGKLSYLNENNEIVSTVSGSTKCN